MSFLPIVERELRVAARRKSTYQARMAAARLALIIFACITGIFQFSNSRMSFGAELGPVLFAIFSWLSFAFVCAAGIFLTADSLSEEKRDGTLGLLFLTDLRGLDVVLGKLFSHSLVATYALLAAFPIIGISFLLGGVTGGEFWRLILVLFNTLFFSLAIGMLVSSVSVDAQRAMTACAAVCALFIILLPMVDWAIAGWDGRLFQARFSLASPGYAMTEARSNFLSDFWTSMAVVHGCAWSALTLACVLAPRHWQEKAQARQGPASRSQRWRFGSPAKRAALRVRWLDENPVRWLAGRDLWMGRFIWVALLAVSIVGVMLSFRTGEAQVFMGVANGVLGLFLLLMNLWVAAHAARFFVEAMHTGTIELMLATPLTPRQIVMGQWWALCRTFLRPVLVMMLLEAILGALQIQELIRTLAKNNSVFPTELVTQQILYQISSVFMTASGLVAVAWFGMWMGLVNKKPNHAIMKTIAQVQVLPGIVFMMLTFALVALVNISGRGQSNFWLSSLIATLLAVAADVAFVLFARKKLFNQLREVAAHGPDGKTASFRWPWSNREHPPVVGQ